MSSPPTGAARKRGAAASATTPRSTLGAPSAGLEPTPEPHRAYVDDPPSRPSRSRLGAPRRGRDLRDERFRREVFDLFEGARSLLSRWSLARFLREWKSRDRTKRAPAEVITIPTDATVGDALSLLARENILSAPVVDADRLRSLRPSPYPLSQFLGFQDVGDFLRDFFAHLDAVLPAPPLPANPVAAAAHAAKRAETPGTATTPTPSTPSTPSTPAPKPKSKPASSAAAAHDAVAEEARRGWIASATRETLETAGAAFCSKTVGEARAKRCGAEDGRMVYAGKGDAPLLDVVRAGFLRHVVEPSTYADGASGDEAASTRRTAAYVGRRATACHRVAVYRLDYDPEVMDDTMVIDAVVSQSDVARFLGEHRAELGAALERNLADLGLAPGVDDDEGVRDDAARDDGAGAPYRSLAESVERVSPTTRAIEAFSLMRSRGVSSVAVCAEPRGKLVDVLALSDFRGARAPGDFADLDLSVAEFAAKRRPPGAGARLVTVRPDADLGDVLRLMSDNGVHRVFVTDLEGRPTRCVTPTDVFRLVALPSAHNLGWRFQATDAGRATYAHEEPTPLAPREDESPPPARRAFGFAGAFDDEM